MNKIISTSSFLIALLILGSSVKVTAGPYHKEGHNHSHEHEHEQVGRGVNVVRVMRHLSKLDLTDQQQSDIKSLIKSGIEESKTQRESLNEMHGQMKKLMDTDAIDEAAIKALSAEMANIKSDLAILRLNKKQQVAALLNDEQRAKLKEMRHKRMKPDHD